jgi:hypothetical protein
VDDLSEARDRATDLAVDAATEELRAELERLRSELDQVKADISLHSMLRVELTNALGLKYLAERTRSGNSDMVAKVCDAMDENAALRRKLAAAEGMAEALETCKRLPIARAYPDGPCLDRADHEEVCAALTAWHEANRG